MFFVKNFINENYIDLKKVIESVFGGSIFSKIALI